MALTGRSLNYQCLSAFYCKAFGKPPTKIEVILMVIKFPGLILNLKINLFLAERLDFGFGIKCYNGRKEGIAAHAVCLLL